MCKHCGHQIGDHRFDGNRCSCKGCECPGYEKSAEGSVRERVFAFLDKVAPPSSFTGHVMTKDEIDDMWGM
jgi:dienelactone hydrolase